MKALDARALFNLFNSDKFSWEGISEESSVAILQTMMEMSDANDKLTKAEDFARKQIVVGRVKELIDKFNGEGMQEGGKFTEKATSDADFEEYQKVVAEAQKKMNDVILPKLTEDVQMPILKKETVAQIIAANSAFLKEVGIKPFALYLILATEPKKEE